MRPLIHTPIPLLALHQNWSETTKSVELANVQGAYFHFLFAQCVGTVKEIYLSFDISRNPSKIKVVYIDDSEEDDWSIESVEESLIESMGKELNLKANGKNRLDFAREILMAATPKESILVPAYIEAN